MNVPVTLARALTALAQKIDPSVTGSKMQRLLKDKLNLSGHIYVSAS
jgi:hypothetical protein